MKMIHPAGFSLQLPDREKIQVLVGDDLEEWYEQIVDAFDLLKQDREFFDREKCWPMFYRLLTRYLFPVCGPLGQQSHGETEKDILVLRYNVSEVSVKGVLRITFVKNSLCLREGTAKEPVTLKAPKKRGASKVQ